LSEGRGILICIEGIDASGKTTQARLLASELRSRGLDVVLSTEPTEGRIGKLIKALLRGQERPPAMIEAVLFALDRFWHVERVIKPALEAGKVVILDRYYYSSLAYQGSAGLDMAWLRQLNSFAPKPDLAIYLDVRPEVALARKSKAGQARTVLEEESIQEAVRRVYLALVEASELVLVNGEPPVDEVARDVLELVLAKLGECGFPGNLIGQPRDRR